MWGMNLPSVIRIMNMHSSLLCAFLIQNVKHIHVRSGKFEWI
jgi:hypothetical protein